jgi:quinol monooxygenase YgiN
MIGVLTFLRAQPDRLGQLMDMLQGMIMPSLGNPGCLAMHLHSDPQDACRLMIYELWSSKTDFDVNGALPQFQWFWQHRMEFLERDVDVDFFDLVDTQQQANAAHG